MDVTSLLLAAFGLALVLEGLPWFAAPGAARQASAALSEQPEGVLRGIGLALVAAGLLLAWWAVRASR